MNKFYKVGVFELVICLTGMLCALIFSTSFTSTAEAATVNSLSDLDYDIVYVRYPRRGDLERVELPDGESPYSIEPGADLVLLHPNGTEDILVDCRAEGQEDITGGQANCSVQDPVISYDGKWVYYSKYGNMGVIPIEDLPVAWRTSTAHSFIYKMRLDVPQSERVEIQLTNLGTGFATDKLAGNSADDEIFNFSIRELGTTPLPDGRILFTSNRDAVASFKQGAKGNLNAVAASTLSQIYVMDDHDGSTPNKNLHLVGHSNLHHVQHPFILQDGRVIFTNWDDAGIRTGYGSATLYIDQPDGGKMHQFLEPHRQTKRVDHFATQISSGKVIFSTYYPAMATFGFGTLFSVPVDIEGPDFKAELTLTHDENRFFSRIGTDELTTHSDGHHRPSPDNTGRYSTPSAGPDDSLFVAYSAGPVVRDPPCFECLDVPFLDSGLYLIQDAGNASITDPTTQLVRLKNDSAYNEMWPRPVVPYQRIHNIERPPLIVPEEEYAPTNRHRGLTAGIPSGITGSSSMQNRESAPLGNDRFNNSHGKDGGRDTGWVVQGADSGVVTNDDVWGVRILVMTPDRYHERWLTSDIEKNNVLLLNDRIRAHIKGYFTHTSENWKILGEFPVRNSDGSGDVSGEMDTSWLAKVPANTPHLIQSIDRFGRTLSSEQTWRHVKPGDTFASCGGCHAHSIEGEEFAGKWADSESYIPWDLVNSTPSIEVDSEGETQLVQRTVGLWGVEFRRDIYPVLESKCASCHSSEGNVPPANNAVLAMFDSTLEKDSYPYQVRAYSALASDIEQTYAHGVTIPRGVSKYNFPQTSRYMRALQSRESFLAWKVYQQRLDGRSNDDRPGLDGTVKDEDLDYSPGLDENCPAASVLSNTEKGLITRWIDLGAPIDLDRPRMRYTDDYLLPVMTLAIQEEANSEVYLRIGALDIESGIDASNSRVEITPDGESIVSVPFSEIAFDSVTGVGRYKLNITRAEVTDSTPLQVFAVVQDNAGNKQMITRTVEEINKSSGNFQFASSTVNAEEGSGSIQVSVFRSEGDTGEVRVDYAVTGGTATNGSDYVLVSGTLIWADGDSSTKNIPLTILDDNTDERGEDIIITLSNPTNGAMLGTQDSMVVTIEDDDIGGEIVLGADLVVQEDQGLIELSFERINGSDGPIEVDYTIEIAGSDATQGDDYVFIEGSLSWAHAESGSKTIPLTIIDDADVESNETIVVILSNPTGGATLGAQATTTITIEDNDEPATPLSTVRFASASLIVTEGTLLEIPVQLSSATAGEVEVEYSVIGGSATRDEDYNVTINTLTWPADVGGSQSISLNIIDDNTNEGDETLTVTLSNPSSNAVIGTPASITITIRDRDASSSDSSNDSNIISVTFGSLWDWVFDANDSAHIGSVNGEILPIELENIGDIGADLSIVLDEIGGSNIALSTSLDDIDEGGAGSLSNTVILLLFSLLALRLRRARGNARLN